MPVRRVEFSRVVHLSHVVAPAMPQWPGDPPLRFAPVAELAAHGYHLRQMTIGEHSATHVNAANSFAADGAGIDRVEAHRLVMPAAVIDCRRAAADAADYRLSAADVQRWERAHGPVPAGAIVIVFSGWSARWNDPAAFFNQDAAGRMHFPGFGLDALDLLIERRGIAGIGIDTHGVDGGLDTTFAINRRALAASLLVIENLANLDQLPPLGATLIAGVLRLQNGTGSPAAVLALVP